jgi:hypothetical protein
MDWTLSSSKNLFAIKDRVEDQAAADVPAVEEDQAAADVPAVEEAQAVHVLVGLAAAEVHDVPAVADQADPVVLTVVDLEGLVDQEVVVQVQVRAGDHVF